MIIRQTFDLHFSTSHANRISCVWNTFERAFWSDFEGNKDTHEHLRYSIPEDYGQNTRPEHPIIGNAVNSLWKRKEHKEEISTESTKSEKW